VCELGQRKSWLQLAAAAAALSRSVSGEQGLQAAQGVLADKGTETNALIGPASPDHQGPGGGVELDARFVGRGCRSVPVPPGRSAPQRGNRGRSPRAGEPGSLAGRRGRTRPRQELGRRHPGPGDHGVGLPGQHLPEHRCRNCEGGRLPTHGWGRAPAANGSSVSKSDGLQARASR
jgi:hypothetical protein